MLGRGIENISWPHQLTKQAEYNIKKMTKSIKPFSHLFFALSTLILQVQA